MKTILLNLSACLLIMLLPTMAGAVWGACCCEVPDDPQFKAACDTSGNCITKCKSPGYKKVGGDFSAVCCKGAKNYKGTIWKECCENIGGILGNPDGPLGSNDKNKCCNGSKDTETDKPTKDCCKGSKTLSGMSDDDCCKLAGGGIRGTGLNKKCCRQAPQGG